MDGLEAVELKLSFVLQENVVFRIDSDFFKKAYLSHIQKLHSIKHLKFDAQSLLIIHPAEIKRDFVENHGIWFFRTQNLRPLKIEDSNNVFISTNDADRLRRNIIEKGDVLITRTGANFGQTAIYLNSRITIASSHVLILRNKVVNQYFLAVFYNTSYGRQLIDKGMYGGAQPEIAPYYIRNIPIPIFSELFQSRIQGMIEASEELMRRCHNLYQISEAEILIELGLQGWQPTQANTEVKTFKNSFVQNERLDAEYYQPKYDELVDKLLVTKQAKPLGELLQFNQRGKQPEYMNEGVVVINSKYIRKNKIDFNENRFGDISDTPKGLIIRKGDVLLNGTGVGTIGRSAPYLLNEPALPDNHVTILRTKEMNPVFLSVMLNSIIGQLQVDKYFKGSSGQIELYPSDINQFVVWDAPKDIQQKVANAIHEATALEKQSQQLLDAAKHAVEMAIEEGEEKAMKWLMKNGG